MMFVIGILVHLVPRLILDLSSRHNYFRSQERYFPPLSETYKSVYHSLSYLHSAMAPEELRKVGRSNIPLPLKILISRHPDIISIEVIDIISRLHEWTQRAQQQSSYPHIVTHGISRASTDIGAYLIAEDCLSCLGSIRRHIKDASNSLGSGLQTDRDNPARTQSSRPNEAINFELLLLLSLLLYSLNCSYELTRESSSTIERTLAKMEPRLFAILSDPVSLSGYLLRETSSLQPMDLEIRDAICDILTWCTFITVETGRQLRSSSTSAPSRMASTRFGEGIVVWEQTAKKLFKALRDLLARLCFDQQGKPGDTWDSMQKSAQRLMWRGLSAMELKMFWEAWQGSDS
jgi:hypothetical protein